MIEGPTAMQVYLPSQNAVLKNQFIALVLPRQSFDLALFTRPENGRSYLLPLLTIKIFIDNSQMQTFATAFNYWQQTKASGSLPPSIQIGITWTEAK
jgi:hypothetical protein